jgi:hypothetical protein
MLILDLYFLRLDLQICFRGPNLKASAGVALILHFCHSVQSKRLVSPRAARGENCLPVRFSARRMYLTNFRCCTYQAQASIAATAP